MSSPFQNLVDESGITRLRVSGVGAQSVATASVPVTSAQILALHDAPVEIVPTPGLGKVIVPLDVLVEIAGNNPYTVGQVVIGAGDVSGNGCAWTDATEAFTSQPPWVEMFGVPWSSGGIQIGLGAGGPVGAALILTDRSANPTAGDGDAVVTVTYHVVTLA